MEQNSEQTLAASWVCELICTDRPPGTWHPGGVPTGAPANALWECWASMASLQAFSTIEYFSSEMIGLWVCVTGIASMNHCTTSKVTFCCWGTLWSQPAVCWGTFWPSPALESGSAWPGTMSDSCSVLIVHFWHLSNGGLMTPAAYRRFGSKVCAMTLAASLHFVRSRTLVFHTIWSVCAKSSCRTSSWWTELASLISDDRVDYPECTLSSSMISQLVSSLSCFMRIIVQTCTMSNTILEGYVGSSIIRSAMKIGCLLNCTCKCLCRVYFLILL